MQKCHQCQIDNEWYANNLRNVLISAENVLCPVCNDEQSNTPELVVKENKIKIYVSIRNLGNGVNMYLHTKCFKNHVQRTLVAKVVLHNIRIA